MYSVLSFLRQINMETVAKCGLFLETINISQMIVNQTQNWPKRLSLDKFFSWFTFVELSVLYFYLLFRCKKMIAFHSCPRDILVTSKRILWERQKKKVNLQMHFLGQAKFMFVSSVDPILSWKTGQGRLRICNFSWDYLKYLLDYLSEIDGLYSWFTFWSENDKIEVVLN